MFDPSYRNHVDVQMIEAEARRLRAEALRDLARALFRAIADLFAGARRRTA